MYVSRADRYYDGSRALSSVKPRWFFNILAYIEQVLTKDEWNPIKVKANNMNSWAILKHYCTTDDLSCVPDLLHLLTRWINDRLPLSSGMNACGTFGLRFLSSNNLEIRTEQWNWKVSAQPWLNNVLKISNDLPQFVSTRRGGGFSLYDVFVYFRIRRFRAADVKITLHSYQKRRSFFLVIMEKKAFSTWGTTISLINKWVYRNKLGESQL